jgi:hypothetical protein
MARGLSLCMRNMLNQAYYTGGQEQAFIAGLFAANVGAPRTIGVRGQWNF